MALLLRMLIVAQIVCVALLGAATRGTLITPWARVGLNPQPPLVSSLCW